MARNFERGFSLVELMLIVMLVGVMSALTVPILKDSSNAAKYEATREKMDAIRVAILGSDAVDNTGRRLNFGYVGDWGSLPTTLTNLTNAQSPAWAIDTAQGVGAGWRGPYVSKQTEGSEGITKDKWGFTFVWSPAASPPTLTSLGADNKAGGAIYDKDLVMEFNTAAFRGTLYGFVMDHTTPQAGKTARVMYPAAGVLTTFSQATDANGAFSFSSVPFGPASLTVTGSPQIGPRAVQVESPYQVISGGLLNYFRHSERIKFVLGSFSAAGTGGTVTIRMDNNYNTAKTIDFLTHWEDRQGTTTEGFLRRVALAGVVQLVTPGVASDTRVDITTNMVLPANSTNNTFQLSYTTTAAGGVAIDMSNSRISGLFEWVGTPEKDVVSFP